MNSIGYVGLESAGEALYIERFETWTLPNMTGDTPHRHDFHEVIWFESGSGQHWVDQSLLKVQAHHLSAVARGQVHAFANAEAISGYLLCFREEFLPSRNTVTALFNTGTIQDLSLDAASFALGNAILKLLLSEFEGPNLANRAEILSHLTSVFLALVERLHQQQFGRETSQYSFYRRFLELLETYHCQHHDVVFYASGLYCSAGQLSKLLQRAIGKTAKQIILERVLLEAKRHLRFSHASIKEIAFELGFTDPSHFSKVFKSQLNLSPVEYRQQNTKKHMV